MHITLSDLKHSNIMDCKSYETSLMHKTIELDESAEPFLTYDNFIPPEIKTLKPDKSGVIGHLNPDHILIGTRVEIPGGLEEPEDEE